MKNIISREELTRIAERYNTERLKFDFPTTACSESAIESMFSIWPELKEYSGDELIYEIALINYNISFG